MPRATQSGLPDSNGAPIGGAEERTVSLAVGMGRNSGPYCSRQLRLPMVEGAVQRLASDGPEPVGGQLEYPRALRRSAVERVGPELHFPAGTGAGPGETPEATSWQ